MRYKEISGVLLAGGKNSRIGGINKSFLKLKGERIIDSILKTFLLLFNEIVIVTNSPDEFKEFEDVKIVADLIKDCGPLGGIYTGLKTMSNDKGLFAACDMPFLEEGLLRKLLDISENSEDCAVIPCEQAGLQPLCAVYPKKALAAIEKALSEGRLAIRDFLKDFPCKLVNVNSKQSRAFYNINTPEDLRYASSRAEFFS